MTCSRSRASCARALDLRGPAMVVSTACASSARSLRRCAQHLIASGVCDAAVVGGADSLCRMTLHGFAVARSDLAGPMPALRRRPRRNLDRRGRRLRAAGTRAGDMAGPSRCSAAARAATAITCPRRIPRGAARSPRCARHCGGRPGAGADRLRQPARHRHQGQRRHGGSRASCEVFGDGCAVQLDQGLDRAHARRRRDARGGDRRALHPARLHARLPQCEPPRSRASRAAC